MDEMLRMAGDLPDVDELDDGVPMAEFIAGLGEDCEAKWMSPSQLGWVPMRAGESYNSGVFKGAGTAVSEELAVASERQMRAGDMEEQEESVGEAVQKVAPGRQGPYFAVPKGWAVEE